MWEMWRVLDIREKTRLEIKGEERGEKILALLKKRNVSVPGRVNALSAFEA